MFYINTKTEQLGHHCSRMTPGVLNMLNEKLDGMVKRVKYKCAEDHMAGWAIHHTNGLIYLMKYRARITSYEEYKGLDWETVSMEQFNLLITNDVRGSLVSGKYYIVKVEEDK